MKRSPTARTLFIERVRTEAHHRVAGQGKRLGVNSRTSDHTQHGIAAVQDVKNRMMALPFSSRMMALPFSDRLIARPFSACPF